MGDALRQQALKLMRYANSLTPYKLDEPLDPMVTAALEAWVAETVIESNRTLLEQVSATIDRLQVINNTAYDGDLHIVGVELLKQEIKALQPAAPGSGREMGETG